MIKENLIITWILCKKNISLYIKRGPVLIFGLMFPFFITLSWVIGRNLSPSQIFIGIVAMTAFFTSTAISPVVLPVETREKSLERQLYYPISIYHILLGILFASFLYSFIITLIITIAFIFILSVTFSSILQIIILIIGIGLITLFGSSLGLLLSGIPSDMTSDIMVVSNLIKFPLVFISGVFIPLNLAPFSLLILSLFSPLTYFTDLMRFCTNTNPFFNMGINLAILVMWIIILLIANIVFHRKTMPKRFSEGNGNQKKSKKKGKA
ncbi:MAG: ABC transporter permease [Promethearchaeota archaeon]|nr:MAG: ABC transporter permease [Candidatus Lokiarchaeota archaeon]